MLETAPALLGKIFTRVMNRQVLAGRIVEVEAYDGKIDEAAHTFAGKTKRNEIMFEDGGFLYVYFTYGMHFCCNVVSGKKDHGQAVLIRAIEPLLGIEIMAENRFGRKKISGKDLLNIASGPAKICQAFGIGRDQNGTDLTKNEIFILDQPRSPKFEIVETTRVGIKKSKELPWRFYIKNSKYISKK